MFDRNTIEFLQAAKTNDDLERLMNYDIKYRVINNKYKLLSSVSALADFIYHTIQYYHLFFLADYCLVL